MRKRLTLILLLSAFLSLALAGCGEKQTEPVVRDELVTFLTFLDVNDAQEVVVDLAVYSGSGPLPADETFNGRWELNSAGGQPRAAADVHQLDSVPGGTEKIVFSWRGELAPGKYEMSWGAPDYGGTVVEFEVVEGEDGVIMLADHVSVFNTSTYPPSKPG